MRKFVVAGLVVVPLVAVAAAIVAESPRFSGDPGAGARAAAFPAAPIPGGLADWNQALARGGSLPRLPEVTIANPCGGPVSEVRLLATWTSPDTAPDKALQIGMNYSNGLWMSLADKGGYDSSISKSTELPKVEEAFSRSDFPSGLADGEVLGHSAWIKELDGSFDCVLTGARQVELGVESDPNESFDVATTESMIAGAAVMFDPTAMATITWMEHDYVVELVGPYPADQLVALANKIQWMEDAA